MIVPHILGTETQDLILLTLSGLALIAAVAVVRAHGRTSRSLALVEEQAQVAKETEARCQQELQQLRADSAGEVELLKAEAQGLRSQLLTAEERQQNLRRQADREHQSRLQAEVVSFLALLQERGRLIDFLLDDVTAYSDEQVGRAARVIHQGCSAVLKEYFDIAPLHQAHEGDEITVEQNYRPECYRLIGRVTGSPPFRGRLLHHGWSVQSARLPHVVANGGGDAKHDVLAPAEVEIDLS